MKYILLLFIYAGVILMWYLLYQSILQEIQVNNACSKYGDFSEFKEICKF